MWFASFSPSLRKKIARIGMTRVPAIAVDANRSISFIVLSILARCCCRNVLIRNVWVLLQPKLLPRSSAIRSEEHTSELQSRLHLVCRLLLEKKYDNRV